MASKESNNISRHSGETYPSKTVIKINAVPISLEGWTVEIRYKIPAGTLMPDGTTASAATEMVIDGVVTNIDNGKVNIYPHARLRTDPVLLPADYVTTELRAYLIDQNGGSDVGVPQANQVWDDEEVAKAGGSLEYPFYIVRLKEYAQGLAAGGYIEEQVHNTGFIQITSRWVKEV